MGASESPCYGFVTVAELGGAVLIGGYLILNSMGRPLEFHCTEPVKPNRAQQILYGATLEPYLYGEQIGQALVDNGQMRPDLIINDRRTVHSLRELSDEPVVWLTDEPGAKEFMTQKSATSDESLVSFSVDDLVLCLDKRHQGDLESARLMVAARRANWDLREPFERIADAVGELQKVA